MGFSYRRSISIEDDVLIVKSTFYTSRLHHRKIVNVALVPAATLLKLDWRSNGIAMPGLQSGWFRSAGKRYFIDATRDPNIVLMTKSGDGLGLEVNDPAAFKRMLDTPN